MPSQNNALSKASSQAPNRVEAAGWVEQGDRLLAEKKFEAAAEAYAEAIKIQPNLALHHCKLGNVLLRQKQFERAERCFRQALAVSPQSHLGLYGLGQAVAGLERWEEAVQIYRQVIELKPSFLVSAWLQLGNVLSKQHKWDEAITSYQTAIEIEPDYSGLVCEALGEALIQQELYRIESPLKTIEKELIERHPLPNKIFLPTEKIPLADRVEGLKRVINIYENRWTGHYRKKLLELKEKYKNYRRAFIIGNGPSINLTDLELLKDEITFGVNGIFLKSLETGFTPTFYVVEDHLVAEDRQQEIRNFKGSTKLFPINLAYCIDEAEDTIFFNHRPRKSYPDGYDFSTDASDLTYAGCTVTFTCIQLAYFLGFREIYLIGVDCNYAIPEDVKIEKEYAVETLDMQSDDLNHFHPDYFGKGYRWHDPQVHKMKLAYQEARRICNETNVDLYNATIGGKLEIFPRINYYSLFPLNQVYPRILIIDRTRMGGLSATGQVKQNLFSGWPPGNILQIYSEGENDFRFFSQAELLSSQGEALATDQVLAECKRFNPSVVYYRPVPDSAIFHVFACQLIDELGKPLVTHIMDDWPDRLAAQDVELYSAWDHSLRSLLAQSATCLSIGAAMSEAFQERYGLKFQAIANCIDPKDWLEQYDSPLSFDSARPFVIRYIGSLAEDMTFTSVYDIAAIVSELQSELSIQLEIYTGKSWLPKVNREFSHFAGVFIYEANLTTVAYRKLLGTADLLLLAYNFDEVSVRYTKYSVANKLPECLASGIPLLVYGPEVVDTIAYSATTKAVQLVTERDSTQLKAAIRQLEQSSELRQELGRKARQFAFENHNTQAVQLKFYSILRHANNGNRPSGNFADTAAFLELMVGYCRQDHAHLDETDLVFEFLKERSSASVMIDVGAHFGTALKAFAQKGWQVFAFEPDPSNREKLMATLQSIPNANVKVDVRAVTDRILEDVSFFTSQESTGVSTLKPFLASHEERCKVSTTTLTEVCSIENITSINFLKIDTEGHDLMVLKGVPWNQVQPDVIECEFEDSKTAPLGYTFHDLAGYLSEKGYTVLVSEWHPIIRYGIRHEWHRLVAYPCQLSDPAAWGNIIAFKIPPDFQAIAQLTRKVLQVQRVGSRSVKSYIDKGDALIKQGRLIEALAEFQRALDLKPDQQILHYKIGELLFKQKKYSEASQSYQRAIDIQPDYFWAWRGLGDAEMSSGNIEQAVLSFQKTLEMRPGYFYAYHRLGDIAKHRKRWLEAIEFYGRALEIQPDAPSTLKALAECVNRS